MTEIRTPQDLAEAQGVVTVQELAAVLRCSDSYIYKAIRCGVLETRRLGVEYRIPADAARRLARDVGAL